MNKNWRWHRWQWWHTQALTLLYATAGKTLATIGQSYLWWWWWWITANLEPGSLKRLPATHWTLNWIGTNAMVAVVVCTECAVVSRLGENGRMHHYQTGRGNRERWQNSTLPLVSKSWEHTHTDTDTHTNVTNTHSYELKKPESLRPNCQQHTEGNGGRKCSGVQWCRGYELDYYGGGKTFLAAPFVDVHQI
jgi:hypothetical protein